MAPHRIHSVRFYKPEPNAINCLCYESDSKKLALSRSDNCIEIWDLSHTPHIDRVIYNAKSSSVESLSWCNDRLFSSGLNGMVCEYDLLTLLPKYKTPVTSGPCWCLAVNGDKTSIAAGTEDGYINLFQITEDAIMYDKILDKQEGRIMCLAWSANGERIVTGSEDAVRIWNVKTGHAIHKMTTGRAMTNKPTIVWCVTVTDDFTIITGDSRGKLCMWDGNSGTNIASHQSHKADVLSVCLDEIQTTVYATGVDPLIATFERIQMRTDGSSKWVRSIQRRIHDHDVRALAFCHGRLFSGGIDGYLALSSYPPKVLLRYPPLLQPPVVCLASLARCVLLRYPKHLELWRLGDSHTPPSPQITHPLPLSQDVVKLVQLLSKDNVRVRCAAVSPDASWLAYSTDSLFRLYTLDLESDKEPRLSRVSGLSAECNAVHCAQFAQDSKLLVCATSLCTLMVYDLSLEDGPSLVHTFTPLADNLMSDLIHLLCISPDNNYIIAADRKSNIVVWSKGKYYCSLPKYNCAPTAMAVHPQFNHLVVVYCDHKVVEYALDKRKYTKFSRNLSENHPKQWLSRGFPVINVTFDPLNSNVIIMHDDSTICVIDKKKSLPSTDAKIPRLELNCHSPQDSGDNSNQYPPSNRPQHAFHVVKKYKHLVYLGNLSEGEMVAVEVNPLTLAENLPATLKQKHFGAM